ncbi:uncharacterized protein [Maniola hyperantus]|uniref:uncharacterized protein n=1 Tax=Aphantopus hyperantus TaxID=2795564 RepID=UPI00213B613F
MPPWKGEKFFISLDMSLPEAKEKGYEYTPRPDPEGPLPQLKLYCPKEDKSLCLYYDEETGHIRGLNIAIRKDAVSEPVFDMSSQGWTTWKVTSEDGSTATYLCKRQFYCSEEFLKKTPEERIAMSKENHILPESAIWVSGFNEDIYRISTSEDTMLSSNFTKQATIPMMGTHYYYRMTPETECNKMFPWFTLCNGGKVMGLGLMMFAEVDDVKNGCELFEKPSQAAVQAIVNNGPECLYNIAAKPGVRTYHIYFTKSPWCIL